MEFGGQFLPPLVQLQDWECERVLVGMKVCTVVDSLSGSLHPLAYMHVCIQACATMHEECAHVQVGAMVHAEVDDA